MRVGTGVALLAVTLLAACAHTDPEKAHRPAIRKVIIEGAKGVKPSEIKPKILNTESPFYTLWMPYFLPPQLFNRDTWAADLRRVERFYQAQGYFQAEVTDDAILPQPHGTGGLFLTTALGSKLHITAFSTPLDVVDLKITVVEGNPTHITAVNVRGMEQLPPKHQSAAMSAVTLKEGAVFKEMDWDGVKEKVQSTLRELGYAEAKVTGDVFVETTNQTARVSIRVAPGRRYQFGEVYVTQGPNPQVPAKRVQDEAHQVLKKGDWYSDSALDTIQQRVTNLGVFGAVKVSRAAPDPETGLIPVTVDVREAPFHTIKYGGGIGADLLRWEAHLSTEYTDRNFLGDLRKLTLKAKAGWAFLPNPLAVVESAPGADNGPIFDVSADLEQPQFLANDLKLQVGAEGLRELEQAYTYYEARPHVGVAWQPHPSLAFTASYNLQYDKLFQSSVFLNSGAPTFALGCKTSDCNLLLGYFEETVEWDRRNDKNEPTRGYFLNLNVQEGRSHIGEVYNYLRILPEARGYYPITPKISLAARVRAGSLYTNNGADTVITTRFYSGGSYMRGFNTRRLSPMLAVPQQQIHYGVNQPRPNSVDGVIGAAYDYGQTVAIGGNGLADGQFEIRYKIVGALVLALFFDTGLVTTCPLGQKATTKIVKGAVQTVCEADGDYLGSNLQYAVGFGLRYGTPVGPIRFDFAYRLGQGYHRDLEVEQPAYGPQINYPSTGTCFGLFDSPAGSHHVYGSPDGPCTVQLSIGEAF